MVAGAGRSRRPRPGFAARVKAGLFAGNWTGPATVSNGDTITTSLPIRTIPAAWASAVTNVASEMDELPLDGTYANIKPGSWVAIDRPVPPAGDVTTWSRTTTFHMVVSRRTGSVATPPDTGFRR